MIVIDSKETIQWYPMPNYSKPEMGKDYSNATLYGLTLLEPDNNFQYCIVCVNHANNLEPSHKYNVV